MAPRLKALTGASNVKIHTKYKLQIANLKMVDLIMSVWVCAAKTIQKI